MNGYVVVFFYKIAEEQVCSCKWKVLMSEITVITNGAFVCLCSGQGQQLFDRFNCINVK